MANAIVVRPNRLKCFKAAEAARFVVVTEARLAPLVRFEDTQGYRDQTVHVWSSQEEFDAFLRAEPETPEHLLIILPSVYFVSPAPELLGPRRKLAVMACFSAPSSVESIGHFLQVAEHTDPDAQADTAERFFRRGEAAEALVFKDRSTGRQATFRHLRQELLWHEQLGSLDWGQQQLLPSGEISVLPVSVFGQNIESRLDVEGELVFRGTPVVHAGSVSFLPSDQSRIFERLSTLGDYAVKARIEKGAITDLCSDDPGGWEAVKMFETLIDVDSRYATLLEIGFGINTSLKLFPGNCAMNEVYGGTSGVVHFGLGLLPYTQYHIDIICPQTEVRTSRGEPVLNCR